MIPKRQDLEKSTEEQEQEAKEGKTHTADKAKKGEIDNGDLSHLTVATGQKGGTHTGDADVERWKQQSGGSKEFITHMTVKRDSGTGSVPCLHIKLSCSRDFSKSVSLSLENNNSTSLGNSLSFDKPDFSSTQVLNICNASFGLAGSGGEGTSQVVEAASPGDQTQISSKRPSTMANGIRDRRGMDSSSC